MQKSNNGKVNELRKLLIDNDFEYVVTRVEGDKVAHVNVYVGGK